MKQQIQERFDHNMARVKNLMSLYARIGGEGRGRRPDNTADILRAATVFLHATVEDVLRSLSYWKLPNAAADVLQTLNFPGTTSPKFTFRELEAHRGKTVDEVITAAANASLERSNYNSADEVAKLFNSLALNIAPVQPYLTDLQRLMARRHQIVHRGDRNPVPRGRGNHPNTPISPRQVEIWVKAVRDFVSETLRQV